MKTKETTTKEQAYELRSALIHFQSAKGHLEERLIAFEGRIPYSADSLLGNCRKMDSDIQAAAEWAERLSK